MAATQVAHPTRAVIRTVFAALIAFASLVPDVIVASHVDGTILGGQAIAVAAGVTRVLALPSVDAFLSRFLPWLAAAPYEAQHAE